MQFVNSYTAAIILSFISEPLGVCNGARGDNNSCMYSLHFYLNIVFIANLFASNGAMVARPLLNYWGARSKYGLITRSTKSDGLPEYETQFLLNQVSERMNE